MTCVQVLQSSISYAIEAQRLDSEQQLLTCADFILPKWPLLRTEITKVQAAW